MAKSLVDVLIISFILTVVTGLYMVPVLKRRKVKQTVRNDGPKSHLKKNGTPTMGGLICIVSIIPMILYYLIFKKDMSNIGIFVSFLASSILLGIIGFIDDFIKVELHSSDGLSPKLKMILLIIISSILMIVLTYVIKIPTNIKLFFGNSILLAPIIKILLDILVIISTTNAVNLTDGIDGLASSVGIMIMTFLAGYAIKIQNFAVALFLAMVIGAYIGFLLFNWHKAKIFMGDVGSFFLGAVIAIAAILLELELFLPIIAIIPVFEAISVMIQVGYYKKTKKRFFKMAPIHHHFENSGWSELKVVTVFTMITIFACIIVRFIL